MTNRSSSADCWNSVSKRHLLLQELLKHPEKITTSLLKACESQTQLAALSLPERGITSLSRNSMYKYADEVLQEYEVPNGFKTSGQNGKAYLDWLRNQIKVIGANDSLKRTKAARELRFEERNKELMQKNIMVRSHSVAVGKAYIHLLLNVKSLQKDESLDLISRQKLLNIISDHDRMYSDLFEEVGAIRPGNVAHIR